MSRALEPLTPEFDIATRRAFAEAGGPSVVLTPDLAAFCQAGLSVIVAACLRGEAPVAGLGCGSRVLPSGRFRLLLLRPGNEAVLDLAARGGTVSATFSQPLTHRSIQLKGSRAVIVEPDEEDAREAVRQSAGLRGELVLIDYPPAFAEAYCSVDPANLAAIDLTLDSAFVQTPGPGAGAELKP